jgi:hypothetical protein
VGRAIRDGPGFSAVSAAFQHPAALASMSIAKIRMFAVVTLKRGKATWTFPPKKLRPGTYRLNATYASSNCYDPVTTAMKKFVVTS